MYDIGRLFVWIEGLVIELTFIGISLKCTVGGAMALWKTTPAPVSYCDEATSKVPCHKLPPASVGLGAAIKLYREPVRFAPLAVPVTVPGINAKPARGARAPRRQLAQSPAGSL